MRLRYDDVTPTETAMGGRRGRVVSKSKTRNMINNFVQDDTIVDYSREASVRDDIVTLCFVGSSGALR